MLNFIKRHKISLSFALIGLILGLLVLIPRAREHNFPLSQAILFIANPFAIILALLLGDAFSTLLNLGLQLNLESFRINSIVFVNLCIIFSTTIYFLMGLLFEYLIKKKKHIILTSLIVLIIVIHLILNYLAIQVLSGTARNLV